MRPGTTTKRSNHNTIGASSAHAFQPGRAWSEMPEGAAGGWVVGVGVSTCRGAACCARGGRTKVRPYGAGRSLRALEVRHHRVDVGRGLADVAEGLELARRNRIAGGIGELLGRQEL